MAAECVLHLGDALEVLRTLDAESVDALVTDPPAGIGFMGKEWDDFRRQRNEADAGRGNVFGRTSAKAPEYARRSRAAFVDSLAFIFEECIRVLKPGAHGLVWAIPRTSHWTGWALEDGGFEVRDRVSHFFGSGFPKSLNLPGGLGTALKPAVEDWWLVRKPLDGTVSGNVDEHGTGALNIDGCRLTPGSGDTREGEPAAKRRYKHNGSSDLAALPGPRGGDARGRWPANLTLDEEAAALLDGQSGELTSGTMLDTPRANREGWAGPMPAIAKGHDGDSGGASRFFYVAKPDRGERDIGCYDLPAASGGAATDRKDGSAGLNNPRAGAGRRGGARNIHPTVKPVDLMRWLCRLVTPKGGLVLDPFMGSGTTGVACAREGFRFIGVEREAQYMEIAKRRIHGDAPLLNRPEVQTA